MCSLFLKLLKPYTEARFAFMLLRLQKYFLPCGMGSYLSARSHDGEEGEEIGRRERKGLFAPLLLPPLLSPPPIARHLPN